MSDDDEAVAAAASARAEHDGERLRPDFPEVQCRCGKAFVSYDAHLLHQARAVVAATKRKVRDDISAAIYREAAYVSPSSVADVLTSLASRIKEGKL